MHFYQKDLCTKKCCNWFSAKAGLVPRGFKEQDVSELKKNSPTCISESLRLLFIFVKDNGHLTLWIENLHYCREWNCHETFTSDLLLRPTVREPYGSLESVCMVWLMLHCTGTKDMKSLRIIVPNLSSCVLLARSGPKSDGSSYLLCE